MNVSALEALEAALGRDVVLAHIEIGRAVLESNAVWETWSNGSKDWQGFCGPLSPTTVTTPPPPVGGVQMVEAGRHEFADAVRLNFPKAGHGSMRGAVLLAMARYGKDDGTDVYPSNTRIANDVGLTSREQVNRHVSQAVGDGWLRPDGKVGRAVRYRLAVPQVPVHV